MCEVLLKGKDNLVQCLEEEVKLLLFWTAALDKNVNFGASGALTPNKRFNLFNG